MTPVQIAKWEDMTGGDTELIDGFDEITPEAQEKVLRALEQGHVDDEDWRGVSWSCLLCGELLSFGRM